MPSIGRTPEFLLLIERAAREPIEVSLPNKSSAIQLRQRFHSFRRRLSREIRNAGGSDQPRIYASLSEQVETALREETDGTYVLVFRPAEWEFREAFRKAGIIVEDTSPPAEFVSETDSVSGTAEAVDPLDEYLRLPRK